jgi:hypothetical protein
MGFVAAADPASKTAYVFTNVEQLDAAITQYGFIPLGPDGAQLKVQEFEGGKLLQGAPINVWMGKGWYAGQRELLEPLWASGQVPRPPSSILNEPVFEMPPDVAANYNAYKEAQNPLASLLGPNSGVLVAVVAAGAALWFLSSGSKSSGRDSGGYI